ncbi:hypothetical protein [Pararhizobium arenae]|uniref:hypothetical protein n=1 Tax=Pararhizobium arenae TaxID=1856850 RepID=UPI00094AA8C5|nr:hypothetical protein [Pararhizobium arenae]
MIRRFTLAMTALISTSVSAYADPVGTYKISGTNLETNEPYSGMLTIERAGGVYAVEWDIDGEKLSGVGLGGKLEGANFTVGSASPDDTVISLGYSQNNAVGMGIYLMQPDGSWEGVWTAEGLQKSNPEKWVPAR